MIVRSALRCPVVRRPTVRKLWPPGARQRKYSTASPVTSDGGSSTSMLGVFTNELDKISPRFDIRGSQIQILQSPIDFYESLKSRIKNAESRIFLSTLYIGKTEYELVSTLREALISKPTLKLSVLFDALRGTREEPNVTSASLLASLVEEFGPDRVEIRLYHTPNLTGLRKKFIPKRINEGWGLQHMKLYGIDDEIIISGANLSEDYFTNRQDRYHIFSSAEITDYFWKLHNAVSKLSFLLVPDCRSDSGFYLTWPTKNEAPSPLKDPTKYVSKAASLLKPILRAEPREPSPEMDTSVYPLLQLTQLLKPDVSSELPAITSILKTLALPAFSNSSWTFTAGYFNPDPVLKRLLISTKSSSGTVVTASQWANGFYGSKGVSSLIPPAYTLLSRRFFESVQRAGRGNAISVKEWRKGTVHEPGGWTYHAKGLWVTMPNENDPSIALVGSSNYTKRSYSLDLEANALIVTKNPDLQRRLGEEKASLQKHAREVGADDFAKPERRVGFNVRVAMWIVNLVGGAL